MVKLNQEEEKAQNLLEKVQNLKEKARKTITKLLNYQIKTLSRLFLGMMKHGLLNFTLHQYNLSHFQCGHCQALQPEWDKLPGIMKSRVNIAKIDATKNQQMAQKFRIKGFPTMYLMERGNKESPVTYEGERTAKAMSDWLNNHNIGEEKL